MLAYAEVPIMEVGKKENRKDRKDKIRKSNFRGLTFPTSGYFLGIVGSWVNTFYIVCSKSLYNIFEMKSTNEFSKSFTTH